VSDGGATHRAAFLAALLTPFARPAIDGPTPLFRFDGSVSGVGKTKQADIISIITTGRKMARLHLPERPDELEKLIGAIALAGDLMILFDNVENGGALGGPVLDMVGTSARIKIRILGKSESPEMPWRTILYASGNNVSAAGDGLRRILPVGLHTDDEHPETRTDFRIPGCILAHTRSIRPQLVHACLTILRAYAVAGRPTPPHPLPKMDFAEVGVHGPKWMISVYRVSPLALDMQGKRHSS
jgi:hypothetical protein